MLVATIAGKKPPTITNEVSGRIGMVMRTLPPSSDISLAMRVGRAGVAVDADERSRSR
jgi:hypothetical protein